MVKNSELRNNVMGDDAGAKFMKPLPSLNASELIAS